MVAQSPQFSNRVLILILPLLLGLFFCTNAQQKWLTTNGVISFTSNAPLEMIRASSDKVQGTIEASSLNFAFLVPIRSFNGFNSDLQRQHFNENYMQSEMYPRATFAGKIIEQVDFSVDSTYTVRAKGELDIHGQKQTRIIRGTITVSKGKATIESSFIVPLADHNITIPKIVNQKIATEIEVSFSATLTPEK